MSIYNNKQTGDAENLRNELEKLLDDVEVDANN